MVTLVKDKELDSRSCSWMRAFQNVKKHKLFQLRCTTTHTPLINQMSRRRQEELLRLNLQLHKYRSYVEQMAWPKGPRNSIK